MKKKADDDLVNGVSLFFRTLAQYSLIGLLRVNCLLGDYVGALKALDPIDIQEKTVITRVLPCHLSLYYYMGFAFLCLHRYLDALKTFSHFLLFTSRSREVARAGNQIGKRVEKMQGLLGIALALSPTANIEDSLLKVIQDRFGGEKSDKFQRLQAGELAVIEEAFQQSCPKFIIPTPPDYSSPGTDALHLQKTLFMREVKSQLALSNVCSYLRMCSSISCAKLASFLKTDSDTLNSHLLNLKHKGRQIRWKSGSATSGEWTSVAEVNFQVSDDMVHVTSRQRTSHIGGAFIRNIFKLEDMIKEIRSLRPMRLVGGPGGVIDDSKEFRRSSSSSSRN